MIPMLSRRSCALAAALLVFVFGVLPAHASILGISNQEVKFDDDDAEKAKWSEPDRIQVHADGLGWGTSADQGARDFWLQTTEPIALGESWRPPISANLRVTVEHSGRPGILYARYSPDAKNWSNWQVLASAEPRKDDPQGQHFQGEVRVPYREREKYSEMLQAYSRRDDVAWRSDEEAFVKELVQSDPRFFRRQTPFVGYVQFLYETQLEGGARIKGLKAEAIWAIGGVLAPPNDPEVYKHRSGPWRFKAE
jgi:hypothetical protein